ncbi:MAG: hypothetical protein WB755_05980 [Terriglobales bacterium]|jgi:hypothetical protein
MMSEAQNPRRIGRSVAALLAGMVTGAVPVLATDAALHATGVFPSSPQPASDALLLLATAYRVVYGVAGSYLTAWLAPNHPMRHVLVLGVLGTVLGIVGVVVTWGRADVVGHEWYPIALAVLAIPQSWLGGVLHRKWQEST